MNRDKHSSELRAAKVMSRKLLSGLYSTHMAHLIVDRKFSRIPLATRLKIPRSSEILRENRLFKAIETIEVNKKDLFRDLALVCFLLMNLPLSLIVNSSKKQKTNKRLSFVYSLTQEQILNNRRTDDLEKFIKEARFQALFSKSTVVVESRKVFRFWGQKTHGNLEIVFDASIWVTRNRLSRMTVLRILYESISILVKEVLVKRDHNYKFTLREVVFDEPIWRYYLRQRVEISVISTQSQLLKLPYVFYAPTQGQISRSMLWYSTNSTPIQNRQTQVAFDPEHFCLENIDAHYVWTEQHKKYLLEYNPDARIFNVGSILFRPKCGEVEIHPLPKNSVVIFDVTPFDGLDTEVLYSKRIMTDFIEDIIFALNSCMITNSVYLKPKRDYTRVPVKDIAPSKYYLEFINQLHQSKKLQILESSLNLYELIDGALLVIGIPFTSPVILAKEMKVESIYYIPDSAQDWIIGSIEDGIKVIQGREELMRYVRTSF